MNGVTVAIPVRDGGSQLQAVLAALATQTVEHEVLVCDSGSVDGSVEIARRCGARVLEIAPAQFSHGGTRNMLMAESSGSRVAFLTQDAQPADEHWLERLLAGFELAPDVGIVFGPYLPRPAASPAVRIELERWFSSLSPDGRPRIERLAEPERSRLRARALIGRRGFFTDANACLARSAWELVPFRDVRYAEDRVLAIDMLRAGYAKAFVPDAAVIHSHDYGLGNELRRCFDEWRGLREVFGWREPLAPRYLTRRLRGELGQAHRELQAAGVPRSRRGTMLVAIASRHVARMSGALLGSRSELLPARVRRVLSLERRADFLALELDATLTPTTKEGSAR